MATGPTRNAKRPLLKKIRVLKRRLVAARGKRRTCGFFEKRRAWETDQEIAGLERQLGEAQNNAAQQKSRYRRDR